jgi:hypothetical protein
MQPKVQKGFGLPDGNDGWTDWTWFHARYPTVTRLTILCEAPANYSGHYRKGRMVACLGERCPLCEMGLGAQARYVLSVVEWDTRRVGLLELGRGQALRVQDWAEAAGSLRGVSIDIVRSSAKKQSGIELGLCTEEVPIYFRQLAGPDPVKALESTWQRSTRITLEEPSGSSRLSEDSDTRKVG